jgi:hypothetical protein
MQIIVKKQDGKLVDITALVTYTHLGELDFQVINENLDKAGKIVEDDFTKTFFKFLGTKFAEVQEVKKVEGDAMIINL